MHGVDAKKFLPVNLSLYIDDIGKHFGAFRCLLKKTAICLYFHCLDTQFPGAIALEYLEGGTETPIAVLCREGELICPKGGWFVDERIYRCIYPRPEATLTTEPSSSSSRG